MLTRKPLETARAALTLLPLAMAILGQLPTVRPRAPHAIVRPFEDELQPMYDPREVVHGRIVLTLPFDAADERPRPRATKISAN
ncbi:MAG: hypothetical protein ACRDJW_25735 [Thermomicrobiales bacterium]